MAQTITPVVHGGSRRSWGVSVALHTIGAAFTASVFGLALGGAGRLLGAPWGRWGLWLVAAIAALYAARELLEIKVPVPALRRQVPEWWRTFFSPHATAFLYGAGLGIGFFTYVTFGTLVAVTAAALASGSSLLGLAIMVPFGAARGLSVLVVRGARTSAALDQTMARVDALALSRIPRWINGLALVAVAAAAVAGATSAGGGNLWPLAVEILVTAMGWAALAKVVAFDRWRASLGAYGLPSSVERSAAYLVPLAEGGVAAVTAVAAPRGGALLALVLLLAFSAAILRGRRRHGDRLPCGCFGGTRTRDYRVLLARNGALGLLGLTVAVAGPDAAIWHVPEVSGSGLVPLLLAGAGLVLGVWVLSTAVRLLRRTGA